ncbi:MAG: hypothetical protein Q8918_15790 [Bacteroidota bacterium]|nr:hypothetical protein [Bacteroidota bacterium]MDP4251566.1 hypothetical protein [Bacteroidota bacterium]
MDAEVREDVAAEPVSAVSADGPDARDTPDDDKSDDKKRDDNSDADDKYDDNVWSHVDDVVVGPEYRRQITNTAKWK